jgi:hypothetical protein
MYIFIYEYLNQKEYINKSYYGFRGKISTHEYEKKNCKGHTNLRI